MTSVISSSTDEKRFIALAAETRTAVDTATAAFHLHRQPQTLRVWASRDNGPIRPVRINGRLAWPVAALKKLLEGLDD